MESRASKIALTVLILATIFWLGGLNIRAMVGFNLFEFGTLEYKSNIHPYVERSVFALLAQSSMVINIAYVVVWVSAVFFLKSTHLTFKANGWLMMSAILFFMFTPVEVYSAILDVRMWYLDFLGSNDLVEYRTLLGHRLGALSGVPMIALLSYGVIIGLIVFQPMRRSVEAETTNAPS